MAKPSGLAPPGSEWRAGWPVLLASGVGCATVVTHAVTLGGFVIPLSNAFGWGRGEITAAISFGSLGTIFLTPLLGRLLDRIGARRVALWGIPLYALSLASLGLAGPGVGSWYLLWALLAVFSMGVSPVVWTMAVASRFDKNRGMALALTLAGMSLATAVMPLVSVSIIEVAGWRIAYFAMAAITLAVAWPVIFACFYDHRDQVRAGNIVEGIHNRGVVHLPGMSVRETLASSLFWRIVVALALVGGSYNALYQHFQPILADSGIAPLKAAAIAGIIGPVSFLSRLLTGFLLDRYGVRVVATPAFALPIISCFLLIGFDGDPVVAGLAIAFTAMAAGAEVDLISFLSAKYFGIRNYGAIYGLVLSGHTIGWAIMPILAGRTFDSTGSYDTILFVMMGMLAVASILAMSFGRHPEAAGNPA